MGISGKKNWRKAKEEVAEGAWQTSGAENPATVSLQNKIEAGDVSIFHELQTDRTWSCCKIMKTSIGGREQKKTG